MSLWRLVATMCVALGVVATMPRGTYAVPPAPSDFPAGFEAYHTFEEMVGDLHTIAQAQPADPAERIFAMSPLPTRSYEGRELWAVKVSDQVAQDEDEPEVLVTALTHGLEHLTVEQALALIHWLVGGYGVDPRITSIVDSTEIWVIPSLNPDGGEFDILGGTFAGWRKNRQPTPWTSDIGTDINRNFGYRWGCCGGSSPDAASRLFRGPTAFSTPESQALRVFVRGRVVDGEQQLVSSISLHSWAERIVFPFSYTRTMVPEDAVADDRRTMRQLALGMAATNGYLVSQAGRWHIASGTFGDWAYARQRVLALTMELAPNTAEEGGTYLPADQITFEMDRNREAMLWFLEQAGCPYALIGEDCS